MIERDRFDEMRDVLGPFWLAWVIGYAVMCAVLKRLGWPRDRYQLLCANCNFGKLMNGGVCPHQQMEAACA